MKALPLLQTRAGALGQWLAPLPFTLARSVHGLGGLTKTKCLFPIHV